MATTFKLEGKVDINASAAQAAVQALSANFTKLSTNSRTSTATLSKLAPILKTAAAAADTERRSIASATKTMETANKVKRESLALAKLTNARTSAVNQGAADKSAIADAQRILVLNRADTEAVRQRNLVTEHGARMVSIAQRDQIAQARLIIAQDRLAATQSEVDSRNRSRAIRDQIAQQRLLMSQAKAAQQAQEANTLSLSGTRNALYGISSAAAIAGAALLGAGTAGIAVGVNWEREFANVQRTTGVFEQSGAKGAQAIESLRLQFRNLVQTLPVTYEELTKIGTLAGQLGVPTGRITEFTKTVAQFSATTDVSSEAAATAFGRLSAVVSTVNGDYTGLADSILKVGVKSVAAESQIINVATQISSIADQAGFSYQQIVGLSGALASIGVPPELSRGVITRVFGDISRSVSAGGTNLEKFAKTSGMTSEQFAKGWKEDAAGTFQKFMAGVRLAGGDAESMIRSLGITSVRDVPILLRLANAADSANVKGGLLAQTMRDAADATGELQKQYQVISGTVGAKLQMMFQSIQAALAEISGSNMGAFGDIIDGITTQIVRFTDALDENVRVFDMFDLPISNAEMLGWGLAITGVVGALGLLVAVLGRVAVGGVALVQLGAPVLGFFRAKIAAVTGDTIAMGGNTAAMAGNTAATRALASAQAWQTVIAEENAAANALNRSTQLGMARALIQSNAGLAVLSGAGQNASSVVRETTTRMQRLASTAAGVGKAFGPELAAGAALLLVGYILQANAAAHNLGSSADDVANSFGKAKTSMELLSSINTNRGGWLPGTEDVHAFVKDIDDVGAGLDNIAGNGMWADFGHQFQDLFRVGQDSSFANMTAGLDKLNAGFAQMVQAGNGAKAAKQMEDFIASARLNDKQLGALIDRMPEYRHALEQALNEKGLEHTNENFTKIARGGLAEVQNAMVGLAGIAEDTLANTFEGSSEDALDFIDTIGNAIDGMVDFEGAYQETLDRVNQKGKEAWVKAGNDVSTYVDVAKASLPDYFATIDEEITKMRTKTANISRVVMAAGPEYAEAAGKLGGDILQQIVDGMNNGDMSGLGKFMEQADSVSDVWLQNMKANATNNSQALYDEFARLGGGSMDAYLEAISKGDRTIEEILDDLRKKVVDDPVQFYADTKPIRGELDSAAEYAREMKIWMQAQADTGPARSAFKSERDFQESVDLWITAHGNTKPAVKDFDSTKSYAEALQIWMTGKASTKPARDEFATAKQYGDSLTAWIHANADTWAAEQALANVANKERYAYIQAQLVNPDGGRPINAGMYGGATGGFFGRKGFEGFAGGGYTGNGHKYQPKGIVHGGEFVFDAVSTGRLGRTFLSGLMASAKYGYANGGAVNNSSAQYQTSYVSRASVSSFGGGGGPVMVELSARDRALLARIPEGLQVRVGSEVVARATNAANLNSGTRGTN